MDIVVDSVEVGIDANPTPSEARKGPRLIAGRLCPFGDMASDDPISFKFRNRFFPMSSTLRSRL